MTEQVINIRDRIEKMRTQMTGPNEAVARNKVDLDNHKNNHQQNIKKEKNINQTSSIEKIENSKIDNYSLPNEKIVNVQKKIIDEKIEKKFDESNKFNQSNFESEKLKSSSANKTYKDYHNDNIFDENKKSIKLDENQAFPQFNLNVSNPISWKLMLLIMLMQLLTNIMLVVVLYLK